MARMALGIEAHQLFEITEMARTLIHEELVRLDAKRHPEH